MSITVRSEGFLKDGHISTETGAKYEIQRWMQSRRSNGAQKLGIGELDAYTYVEVQTIKRRMWTSRLAKAIVVISIGAFPDCATYKDVGINAGAVAGEVARSGNAQSMPKVGGVLDNHHGV